MDQTDTAKLEFDGVSYVYSRETVFQKTAVDGISLRIEPDAVTGIIGHTGSGKSTLAQLANGLLKPSAGRILFDGRDIWAVPKKIGAFRFKIGLVFQYPEYQLFDQTVRDDVGFGPKNMGLVPDEIKARVDRALAFVGLDQQTAARSPFELSGGQRRRAAIAGVIAMQPEVLILDEPAAGLDPVGKREIMEGLCRYCAEYGSTLVFISHSMEDIAQYTQNLIVLNRSKLYLSGRTREIFRHAADLEGIGLDVPQITRVFSGLAARGLCPEASVCTVDDAETVCREQLL